MRHIKAYSTQQALLSMIEEWKKYLDIDKNSLLIINDGKEPKFTIHSAREWNYYKVFHKAQY